MTTYSASMKNGDWYVWAHGRDSRGQAARMLVGVVAGVEASSERQAIKVWDRATWGAAVLAGGAL